MVNVDARPEFFEIPADVRADIRAEVRLTTFQTLHAEAVARKDIAAAPTTHFDGIAGRIVSLLLFIAVGGTIGTLTCVLVVYIMRLLVTVIP
ncbi:MAG: hypothetical protein GY747_01965 [Planctomycetes bacterium]|nr:hypothetical protein [Planctomycetota bacterium]MCP4769994.1 hypothetical protein [Planctomycetota bacterium]MCP4859834.1 hypothetical protein [Planctomycetota bacterium]